MKWPRMAVMNCFPERSDQARTRAASTCRRTLAGIRICPACPTDLRDRFEQGADCVREARKLGIPWSRWSIPIVTRAKWIM